MNDYDISILKSNIKRIMQNSNPKITQSMLAEYTGIPQTRISKVLSGKTSDCFTVPQLASIANYLHTSTDVLLFGNQKRSATCLSVQDVCSMLVKIDQTVHFSIDEKEIEEDLVWQDRYESYSHCIENTNYLMLWLREYETNEEIGQNDYFYVDLNGNSQKREYAEINTFLKKYFQLRKLMHDGTIDAETFNDIIDSHISKLSTHKITDYSKFHYDTFLNLPSDDELPF